MSSEFVGQIVYCMRVIAIDKQMKSEYFGPQGIGEAIPYIRYNSMKDTEARVESDEGYFETDL